MSEEKPTKILRAAEGTTFRTIATSIGDVMVLPPPKLGDLQSMRKTLRASLIRVLDTAGETLNYTTTQRFWSSLCARFGISPNIFMYFDHAEVFTRISERRKGVMTGDGDVIRVVSELKGEERRLLGLTGPNRPIIDYYQLMDILAKNDAVEATYEEGEVISKHKLSGGGDLQIAGEKYLPRFCLKTPIDGYGNPSIYLELVRASKGTVITALSAGYRTEIPLGSSNKGDVTDAVVRMIQTYSNDEGFAAIADRIDKAGRSWASVREARSFYEILNRTCPIFLGLDPSNMNQTDRTKRIRNMEIQAQFGGLIGDLTKIYGLTQLEALSDRKASTLPIQVTVKDLIDFASESATVGAKGDVKAQNEIQGWVGSMMCREFDLEGSKDKIKTFGAFFAGGSAIRMETPPPAAATAPAAAAPAPGAA